MAEFTIEQIKTGGQAGKYLVHIDGELFPLPLGLDDACELMEKYTLQPNELDANRRCPEPCPGRCAWCHITCRAYKSYRREKDAQIMEAAKNRGANGYMYDNVKDRTQDRLRTRPSAKITRSV